MDGVKEKRNKLCDVLGLQRPVLRVSDYHHAFSYISMQTMAGGAAKPTTSAKDTMASYRGENERCSLISNHGGLLLFRSGGQSWLLMKV